MERKRKIYDLLCQWKSSSRGRAALLLDGARRMGKSYLAEVFAKEQYQSYIRIDFNRADDDIRNLFLHNLRDLDTFFLHLSNYYQVKLYPRRPLIILDDVQRFPRARAAVKYLVADGRYDYLETGSLLSIRKDVRDIVLPSEERHLKLYPIDFEEFLWAMGRDSLMDQIRSCFERGQPPDPDLHRMAMDYFRQYMMVGGMPEAVRAYAEDRDFDRADGIKRDLLTLWRGEAADRAAGGGAKAQRVFDAVPTQLRNRSRKFQLSSLSKNTRFRDCQDALFWLEDARMVNLCVPSAEPAAGVNRDLEHAAFKCCFADTGLLVSHACSETGLAARAVYKNLLFDKPDASTGMLLENMAAQMLTASGHTLYFCSNASRNDKSLRMEIEFLISKSRFASQHSISPIEVKTGKNYIFQGIRLIIYSCFYFPVPLRSVPPRKGHEDPDLSWSQNNMSCVYSDFLMILRRIPLD